MELSEIIFYIGATLAIGSFALKNVFHLRILVTISCGCTIAYYAMTTGNLHPIVLNAIIALINIAYILKMRLNEREWKAIQRYKRIHRKKKKIKQINS